MKLAFLLLLLSGAAAADSPEDFAYSLPLRPEGTAPFYQAALPRAVYEGLGRGDAGDVRVFNGAGEVVPHAFRPRDATARQPSFSPPLFPLRGDPASRQGPTGVRVDTRSDGTIISIAPPLAKAATANELQGYIADLSAHKSAVRAIEIERPAGAAPFVGKIKLEASDDLANWRALALDAPVLSLTAAGAGHLKRLRVEFPPQRAKYLKLSWPALMPPIEIAALKVEPGETRAEPPREWKALAAVAGEENEFVFEPGGRFPADRLRIGLPHANTVAQVEVLYRGGNVADPWRALTRAVVYRLQAGDVEVMSPDIEITPTPGQALMLRVDPQGGGIGGGVPTLEIGWIPHELVFAARGAEPFRLAYGSARVNPASLPIDRLIPGYQAKPDAASSVEFRIAPARPGDPVTLAGAAALEQPLDAKRWALWGALVAGVFGLGAMAWRLLRQLGKPGAAPGEDQ